ncbi:MAG: ATP-binding cassette domain-containing protein [Candidatus Lokiarchaeota archaeon]|nr:ATP-binding cassette domain-containing protein [Candidatus Harpocratesius repetitus]
MILNTELSDNFISIFLFIISLIVFFSITIFIGNWGDKIQLIQKDKLIIIHILSLIPGLASLIIGFIFSLNNFRLSILNIEFGISLYTGGFWYKILSAGLILTIICLILVRFIIIRKIDFEKLQSIKNTKKYETLLQVKNLKVYYPIYGGILKHKVGEIKAVNGVSFTIKSGETLGLVGESGCGKSTIAKSLLELIPKEDGEIFFEKEKLPKVFNAQLRQKIQLVFQDPDAALNPRMKVVDILSEPYRNLMGITDKDILRDKALALLNQVSMKREHLDRFPHEFSGGQKQRIVIARALASNPKLIILDEPTSALDVSVQAQILNLLKDLQSNYGYGYLFITHNLSVVHHIADNIAVMYLGKLVEYGKVDEIFENPKHPYTKALLSARSEIDPEHKIKRIILEGEVPSPINPPRGCPFHPRCSFKDSQLELCENKYPGKIQINEDHSVWCHLFRE